MVAESGGGGRGVHDVTSRHGRRVTFDGSSRRTVHHDGRFELNG
jgi:hypothetical protein